MIRILRFREMMRRNTFGVANVAIPCAIALSAVGVPAAEVIDSTSPLDVNQIQEIIVTAERREETLQNVPLTVTAISGGAALAQGITNSDALVLAIPGLNMQQQGNGSTPFLRGVGTVNGQPGVEPGVATYIDGVYISNPAADVFDLNDISRIEVEEGPQGTLFGRNATGGVIQIITRDPSRTPSADLSVGYGNFGTYSESVYATTPISDTTAIDIAGVGSHQLDGWGRNFTTGNPIYLGYNYNFRSKLLWTPADGTEVRIAADYSKDRYDQGEAISLVPGAFTSNGTTSAGFFNSVANAPAYAITEQYGTSINITQDFEWARLVNITAYRGVQSPYFFDQDASPASIVGADAHEKSNTVTEELQIQSRPTSHIQWIGGAFYYNDEVDETVGISGAYAAPFSVFHINGSQRTKSYSAYGQGTVPLFDGNTHVTGGLRYTSDTRHALGQYLGDSTPISPLANQNATFDKTTWRFSLDRQFTPDLLGYVSYNRGFKSGVYNLLSPGSAAVQPEVLDAYELGVKSEWLNHRLRANVSAFYYNYNNIQVTVNIPGGQELLNAAQAHIDGFEYGIVALPLPRLTVTSGFSYIHGFYSSFPKAPFDNPNPVPPACVFGVTPVCGGNTTVTADATGHETVRTPKITVDVGLSYKVPTATGDWDANLLYYFNDGFAEEPDNRLRQPSYNIVNASLGYALAGGKWDVHLWTKNLFDAHYYTSLFSNTFGDMESPAPPRTYGITLGAHF
jgi:iron complex outermembrane receptor protein